VSHDSSEVEGPGGGGPLAGYRVLCLEHAWAGPYASMMLADMGADVVKLEPPGEGDHIRSVTRADLSGNSPLFLAVNRNKRSVTVDLKSDSGRRVATDLAAAAHVVLSNYRPGVLARLGLDYPTLRSVNEALVFTAISGFGQNGPYANRAAYDLLIQAEGGLLSVTGSRDGELSKAGVPVIDIMTAMVAAYSTVCALSNSRTTGTGAYLDISMLEVAASSMSSEIVDFSMSGHIAGPKGIGHPSLTPYQVYETSTTPIALAIINERSWSRFCEVIGHVHLREDARYHDSEQRLKHRDELNAEIQRVLAEASAEEWIERFVENGLPAAHLNGVEKLVAHPQLEHDAFFATRESKGLTYAEPGAPWAFPGSSPDRQLPPPDVGEHGDVVLHEWLGSEYGE